MGTEVVPMSINDMTRIAEAVAKSNMFGMKTVDQALALMALSQAEGLHPSIAIRDYHIIQGRPALKADAMLARFQTAGGKVEWHDYTDEKVSATFSHPQGGSITVDWDMKRAKAAELGGKDNWKKYPRNMLRARVISEGIRTVYPGVVTGMYTPEEVQDFDNAPSAKTITLKAEVIKPEPQKIEPPINPDTGEVSPHTIPVPMLADNSGTDWMEWGKLYASALQSSENLKELDAWVLGNAVAMGSAQKEAEKIHKRLMAIIDVMRLALAPKKEAGLEIPAFLDKRPAA